LDLIKSRRSIRKFKAEKPGQETVLRILKAGLLAPSSMNKKPVELIVVDDRETMRRLKACKNFGTNGLDTAAFAVVVLADSALSDVWVEDAAIAAAFMQLEAQSLGLGSVWIQLRNRQSGTGPAEDAVRKALDIPDKYGVPAVLAFGYKDEDKPPYDETAAELSKVHNGRY
jgi:nitroreductase